MKYEPVIGMEVHAELKTKSKMFCDCENGFGLEKNPNVHICPVCTGQPGTLPVANEEAIKMVIKTGLALNCQIAEDSFFERKNYFYPDLPKGYQISQYQKPLCFGGHIDLFLKNNNVIPVETGIQNSEERGVDSRWSLSRAATRGGNDREEYGNDKVRIGITRIHLEEDTGKLTHPKGVDYSLVDFNRAGVPLMELVTEPDIRSGEQAKKFCQELQLILRYLGVSDADMEKGQMRCEVNISLRESGIGNQEFGTKVEIKNLNSFSVVERAIDYEIKRQSELLENGEKVIQETRGWNDNKGETYSQRIKEESHDYRYFPEPDLPPLESLTDYRLRLTAEIPELPAQKRTRFSKEYGLPEADIEILVNNPELANYFEQVCSELNETEHENKKFEGNELKKLYKLSINYLITEIPRIADKIQDTKYKIQKAITPENFAEFSVMVYKNIISSSGAQKVLEEMFKTGADPSHIIEKHDLAQVSDEGELEKIAEEVIEENPQPSEDYKKGKEASLQFLVGQIMKKSKGKANPQIAGNILRKILK
jgi:aspartyl-tRNA(Asn)/glutamyl-tRNA(Gln) amidotransferase subunit B